MNNTKNIIINKNTNDINIKKYLLKQKIKSTVNIICNNKFLNEIKEKIIIDFVNNNKCDNINKRNIIIKNYSDKNIYCFSNEIVKYLNLDTPCKTMNEIYVALENKMKYNKHDMFYCILLDKQLKILLRYNVNNKKLMTIKQIVERIKLFHIIDDAMEYNDSIVSYFCNKPNPHYMAFFTM